MAKPLPDYIHIPKDFQSRPEFRALDVEAGFHTATAVMLVLWRELAYLAEIQAIGFITTAQSQRAIHREFHGTETAFALDPLGALVRANMLTTVDGGYHCATFAFHNRHLSPQAIKGNDKGGFMTGLNIQKRRAQQQAIADAAQFDLSAFVRADGSPMEKEEMSRVIMLVKLIDNQYARATRQPREYTPGLINDAWRAVTKHSDAMINGVCFWLAKKRGFTPGVPLRTEDALRDFDSLVQRFGRIGLRKRDTQATRIAHEQTNTQAA